MEIKNLIFQHTLSINSSLPLKLSLIPSLARLGGEGRPAGWRSPPLLPFSLSLISLFFSPFFFLAQQVTGGKSSGGWAPGGPYGGQRPSSVRTGRAEEGVYTTYCFCVFFWVLKQPEPIHQGSDLTRTNLKKDKISLDPLVSKIIAFWTLKFYKLIY